HDLVAHPRGAAEAEAAGRRAREVERAPAHERPPVVDADDDGLPVPLVLDADERAEGERAVGRREGVVVVTLAAGGTAALEGAGVAAGDALLEGPRRARAAGRDALDACGIAVGLRRALRVGRGEENGGGPGEEEQSLHGLVGGFDSMAWRRPAGSEDTARRAPGARPAPAPLCYRPAGVSV